MFWTTFFYVPKEMVLSYHMCFKVLCMLLQEYWMSNWGAMPWPPLMSWRRSSKTMVLQLWGGRRQLETGAGPLCDMMDQIRQLNQRVTQLEELHKCCCYGIVLKFLFGNDFQSQLSAVLLQLRCCYWFASAGGYSQMLWLCRHTYWSLNTNIWLVVWCVVWGSVLVSIQWSWVSFYLRLLPGYRRSQDESGSEDNGEGENLLGSDSGDEENPEKKEAIGDGVMADKKEEKSLLPPAATDIATWQ